jgi:hypothetical protein
LASSLKRCARGVPAAAVGFSVFVPATKRLRWRKKENKMRMILVAALAMTASVAMADDLDDAHRQAVSGRDSYWNCLAREYSRDNNNGLSAQDFTSLIASACPSERQNFRVTLVDFLSMQFPDVDAGAHMTTANNAIASAQKDIVTAFIKHKVTPK